MRIPLPRQTVFLLVTGCLVASVSTSALGQRAVATTHLNVRTGPSTSRRVVDVLAPGDTVDLITGNRRAGYYHVRESSGSQGWAYGRYLTLVPAAPESTVANPAPPPVTGVAASAIDSSWTKPAAVISRFSRTGFTDCGPVGDGGDTATNRRKNRTDEPTAYHLVSFDALAQLPYPHNHRTRRLDWPAADLQAIAPYEGVAVSVVGVLASVKPEDAAHGSSGETTNCHATDPEGTDWHITLVKHPGDPKYTGFVVETTPRVRANGHPWTPDMLAPAMQSGDSVRISGWLMLDPEHFSQTYGYNTGSTTTTNKVRATLWEIHPITRIELWDPQHGSWRAIP